ncbi:MAG: YIP1 family protein, partial [bacterium]
LDWASDKNLGDSYSLIGVLLFCVLTGPVVGVLFVHLSAWLLQKTGSWLGGKASFIETRAAVAWSSVPIIWTLLLWIPAILLFGNKLFQDVDLDLQSDFLFVPPLIIVAVAGVVIGIWAIFIFLNCLGEAHRFSAWKALAATILGLLIATCVTLIIVLPYAILNQAF